MEGGSPKLEGNFHGQDKAGRYRPRHLCLHVWEKEHLVLGKYGALLLHLPTNLLTY